MLGTKWTISKYLLNEWMNDFRERSVLRVDQKDLLGRTELRKDIVLPFIAWWTCYSLLACRRFYTSIHLRQHMMASNQGEFLTSTFYNPNCCTILRFLFTPVCIVHNKVMDKMWFSTTGDSVPQGFNSDQRHFRVSQMEVGVLQTTSE